MRLMVSGIFPVIVPLGVTPHGDNDDMILADLRDGFQSDVREPPPWLEGG